MEAKSEMDVLAKNWGWVLVFGIALILLGIMAISSPVATTYAIEMILGWIFIIAGIAQGLNTITCWRRGGFILALLGTALYFVVGVLLLANPMQGVLTLTVLLMVYFLAGGIGKIVMAIKLRGLQNWGWLLFNGIINLVLAILIWMHWPSDAAWVIGLLVGIDILFGGWAMVMISLAVKNLAAKS